MAKDMLAKAVRKFKRGDMVAFDHIYDSTHKVVYFVAYSVLHSKEKAEDITQDTYLKAVEHIDSYSDDTHFVAWLTTIAKRLAINEYNKQKHEVATEFLEEQFGTTTMPDEGGFEHSDEHPAGHPDGQPDGHDGALGGDQ